MPPLPARGTVRRSETPARNLIVTLIPTSRPELRDHTRLGFDLPPADGIARRLIEDWLAAG